MTIIFDLPIFQFQPPALQIRDPKSPPFSSSVDQTIAEKSIAVLPFINDSNDSTNVYIINGLMQSILNDLRKQEISGSLAGLRLKSTETQRKRSLRLPRNWVSIIL